MANRKVKDAKKKKPMSYSVETGIADRFTKHCIKNEIVASNIVEHLIIKYLDNYE